MSRNGFGACLPASNGLGFILGPELAADGDFAAAAAWTLPSADWSIAAGVLNKAAGALGGQYVSQSAVLLTAGLSYMVSFSVIGAAGADLRLRARIAGAATNQGAQLSIAGDYRYMSIIVAPATPATLGIFVPNPTLFSGQFDDFSVRQVL